MVGEGGFGLVFKGWIDENSLTAAKPGIGMAIAVKRLNQEGLHGQKEWLQAHLGDRGLAKELQPGAALREAVVEIFRDVVEEGAGGWGGD
ncbi:hypothetical protein Pyn_39342 [Prunus yedoensis var. nudiflora]|uniref:Protein kinase domain-containing protein n=1 Tax=Prunus yedoensis var. nudiflora TaxID=2094558 RepID=A0A314ZGL1_PRUYE|nr:hypothetical protein Pyn_39342 [Prunus yedoensis var. nudiflora]